MLKNLLKFAAPWVLAALVLTALGARADEAAQDIPNLDLPGLRVAQFDNDDAYDPFADYSDFDEAQEEESDVNFFRHGRLLTVGFMGGMRGFTQGLGSMYTPAFSYGLFLAYFFDLRFALQFNFNTSDHAFAVSSPNQVATGTVNITDFGASIKYYMNTQNVTKGLGQFNPYLIGGFSMINRTTTVNNIPGYGQETAMGFGAGAGIEYPILHNKMYIGLQGLYQMINFPDKNTQIVFDNGQQTGQYPNGDSYLVLGILGVNF